MKKTIYLKQITPMWHFLHNQEGCCLRATEVKPKLDKFLASLDSDNKISEDKISEDKISKNKISEDKISEDKIGDTNAYDYKLSFLPTDNDKLSLNPNDFKLYFGNMGEGPKKELVYYNSPIQMNIFTLHKDLETTILTNLADFFATHSFGTRQDKGFGFFFPEINDENPKELSLTEDNGFNKPHGASYKFTINLTTAREQESHDGNNRRNYQPGRQNVPTNTDAENLRLIFEHINYFHKIIRSGINENKCYHKSFMYFYTKEIIGHTWDKALIKKHFNLFNNIHKGVHKQPPYDKNQPNKDKEDLILFRDALGLSSEQLWLKYNKDVISIKTGKKEFTRFKSPILYRPFIETKGNDIIVTIFIHLDSSGLNLLKEQVFEVSHSKKDKIKPIMNVKVDQSFNLDSYFEYIEKEYKRLLGKCQNKNKPDRYLMRIFGLDSKNPNEGFCKIN